MEKSNKVKRKSLKLKKPAEENSLEELENLYEKLKERSNSLDKEIAEFAAKNVDADMKPQMEALHNYNEMKDITQTVLGYIADISQTTVAELHNLYNLPLN